MSAIQALRTGLLAASLLLALMAAPVLATGAEGEDRWWSGRVVRVFDGDTVWVQPAPGARWRKLRLDGLDAPEICQPGGVAARDALASRVLGQVVQVHERAVDAHGRGLARLVLDGADINAWLVRSGLAWASRWRGQGPYLAEGDAAVSARRGVFAAPDDPEPPHRFRRRHGPCDPVPPGLSAPR